MSFHKTKFALLESQAELDTFYRQHQDVSWLCFDTEFVGEKRFTTSLCLIQVATPHGVYLIDPQRIKDLKPFLRLIEDERILKITHAGDNDYRLLNTLFDVVPRHVFDTQIAAAFVGYKYPVSFRKLVESELRISLDKGYAVTDWEARPFSAKQLQYALEDVLPLHQLWEKLNAKLQKYNRVHWAAEEFTRMESPHFYYRDPHLEAIQHDMMKALNTREQVFLMRLLDWRRRTAETKNYSKEMILPGKLLGHIVRSISNGREGLKHNRRLPEKLVHQHGALFEQLYQADITPAERQLIAQIPAEENDDPREEILQEMLYLLVKYKCFEHGISPGMVMARNGIRKIRNENESMLNGWRRELLGDGLIERLRNFDQLDIQVNDGVVELILKP